MNHLLLHVKPFISEEAGGRADNHRLPRCDALSKSGLASKAFHVSLGLELQRSEKSQLWLSLPWTNCLITIS